MKGSDIMTKKEFTDGWKHFCNHIDFGKSNLDAESIRFMNEEPGKILQTIEQRDDLLAVCRDVADICLGEPMNEDTLAKAKAAIAKAKD